MCIFCKIINNEIPSKKIYEDENVIAILDLSQTTYGHTLVIPKKHCKHFIDADTEVVSQVMSVAHELSQKIVSKCNASGCNILCNCESVAGQTVEHFHVHIIPRYTSEDGIKIEFSENKDTNLDEVFNTIMA